MQILHKEVPNMFSPTVSLHCQLCSKVTDLVLCCITLLDCGPVKSVGIATGCGLDSPGIKSRWGKIFCTCPDRPWGSPSLLYNGYWVFPGGKEWPGCDADPSPPSSAVVKKE